MKKEIAHLKAIKNNYWIECYFRLWSSLAHGILKELLLRVQRDSGAQEQSVVLRILKEVLPLNQNLSSAQDSKNLALERGIGSEKMLK